MSNNTLIAIIATVMFLGIGASQTAKNCRGGLSEDEARKVKNTIERLDSEMDKLKAEKCKCQR
jgi:hypothetical protein